MIAAVSRIILAPLCLCLPLLAGAQTATVNFATTFQTIRGFGGATCTVNYTITLQNAGSFGATIAIENQGTTAGAIGHWPGASPTDKPSAVPGMAPQRRAAPT